MGKCYVDRYFKITNSVSQKKALVTEIPGWIELTFLDPIIHFRGMSEAWRFMFDWGKRAYPRYSFRFPRLATCLLGNDGEAEPIFSSCFTCTINKSKNYYYGIDLSGQSCVAPVIAENVYVSFLMHPGEFYFLNPGVDLKRYQTQWYL